MNMCVCMCVCVCVFVEFTLVIILHADLHRLKWLGALSGLWKALTSERIISSYHRKGKKAVLWHKLRDCVTKGSVVTIALLDTVTSVAASVITTLLLISGDVEENPGPGGIIQLTKLITCLHQDFFFYCADLDLNSVDTTQVLGRFSNIALEVCPCLYAHYDLGEGDLSDVFEEVVSLQALYYQLGRSLRLKISDLRAIRKGESDFELALEDVLLLWLQQKYVDVERFGPPTWRMLVEAVDKKTGGNNHELAKRIASNHPTGIVMLFFFHPKKA